jgi:hypothetical protein
MNCLVFYTNIFFLMAGAVDMKRRLWMMRALSAVLEPVRFKVRKSHQCLPLWNFMSSRTMQTWMDSRMMVKDIGLRFYLRVQVFIAIFTAYYFSATIYLMIVYY